MASVVFTAAATVTINDRPTTTTRSTADASCQSAEPKRGKRCQGPCLGCRRDEAIVQNAESKARRYLAFPIHSSCSDIRWGPCGLREALGHSDSCSHYMATEVPRFEPVMPCTSSDPARCANGPRKIPRKRAEKNRNQSGRKKKALRTF